MRYVAPLMFLFLLTSACATTPREVRQPHSARSKVARYEIMDSAHRWSESLRAHLTTQHTLADVDALLEGSYRDRAEHRTGGYGEYTVYYLIDDFLQVSVRVNVRGELQAPPVVEPRCAWSKEPYGHLGGMYDCQPLFDAVPDQ